MLPDVILISNIAAGSGYGLASCVAGISSWRRLKRLSTSYDKNDFDTVVPDGAGRVLT